MRTLTSTEVKVKSYKIHLMEMVINAIYYNPVRNLSQLSATFQLTTFIGSHPPGP